MLEVYYFYLLVLNPIVFVVSYIKAKKAGQKKYVDTISVFTVLILNLIFTILQGVCEHVDCRHLYHAMPSLRSYRYM